MPDLLYPICRFITSAEMDRNVIFFQDPANCWDKWKRTPWQPRSLNYGPNLKHFRSVMLSGSFIWLGWPNWLNSQSNWQSLFLISLSNLQGGTLCFSILSCPGGLERRAVKIHKMCFCKAFPDIHLCRFWGLGGLFCQTLTRLPSFKFVFSLYRGQDCTRVMDDIRTTPKKWEKVLYSSKREITFSFYFEASKPYWCLSDKPRSCLVVRSINTLCRIQPLQKKNKRGNMSNIHNIEPFNI